MKTNTINTLLAFVFFITSIDQISAQSKRKIEKIFKASEIVNNHYTGFALYDAAKEKMLFELDANKPAIPASNTKIITLYTALNMLGDSIPGLRYITKGDSLIFWGTGDPSMLHPDLKSTKVYDFLKKSDKKLFILTVTPVITSSGLPFIQLPWCRYLSGKILLRLTPARMVKCA